MVFDPVYPSLTLESGSYFGESLSIWYCHWGRMNFSHPVRRGIWGCSLTNADLLSVTEIVAVSVTDFEHEQVS